MSINESMIRRIIREELNEANSLRGGGGIKRVPLFDEERQAIRLVKGLAELYEDLQQSPHTESVMEMESIYRSTREKLKAQQMMDGVYPVIGMAKALADWGLRDADEGDLNEARDHEDEQTRGVTITVGGKRKDGTYPWKKEVAGQPVKKGRAKSEAAAWRAAIDA